MTNFLCMLPMLSQCFAHTQPVSGLLGACETSEVEGKHCSDVLLFQCLIICIFSMIGFLIQTIASSP